MTTPRNRNCIAHCVACNLCFSSDTAFDMHITHEGEHVVHNNPAEVKYITGKRIGQHKFETVPGQCDKQPGCWEDGRRIKIIPVEIWQLAMTDEQRQSLQDLAGRRR